MAANKLAQQSSVLVHAKATPNYALRYAWLVVALCITASTALAQQPAAQRGTSKRIAPTRPDSAQMRRDSIQRRADSLYTDSLRRSSDFQSPVTYHSRDSITLDVESKDMNLYGDADLQYDRTKIKAEHVGLNYEQNLMRAHGIPDPNDSLGIAYIGEPVFEDGGDTYYTHELAYNFKTKKGKIVYTRTQQDQSNLIATQSKRNPDESLFVYDGKFSTCEAEHPHFYIRAKRMKVIPKDKVISGPLHMVLMDVPLPLIIPFGFFPIKNVRTDGVIFPTFGDDLNRGFNLRQGGYYMGLGEHADLKLLGDIYRNLSFRFEASMRYTRRYRANGNFMFQYARNIFGEETDLNREISNNFIINWSHTQPINPNTSFTANVNAGSSNFLRQNSYQNAGNTGGFFTNTLQSSIAFQTRFMPAGNWSLALTLNHSQNTQTQIMNLVLPTLSLSRTRYMPFQSAAGGRAPKWISSIGISYQSEFRNQVDISERNFFKQAMADSMRMGMAHRIGISTNWTMLGYVNISPNISYNEYWYARSQERTFIELFGPALFPVPRGADTTVVGSDNNYRAWIVNRTKNGFTTARDFSFSISASTRIYGVAQTGNKRQRAFRHTITPVLSYSIRPNFADAVWGFYNYTPTDSTRQRTIATPKVSDFDRIMGWPGAGRSSVVSFSLNNLFETKFLSDEQITDSALAAQARGQKPKFTYRNILDNLSTSVSYNLAADSLQLSLIPITARTQLFGSKLNIQATMSIDPYALNNDSLENRRTRINKFEWDRNGRLGRITSGSIVVGMNFSSQRKAATPEAGADNTNLNARPSSNPTTAVNEELTAIQRYREQYIDFNLPWSANINYNLSYSRPVSTVLITQSLNASGEVQLTKKWRIGMSTGWDFQNRRVTFTNFNIMRELHCWELTFSAVPFGVRQYYNLTIQAKASLLQDLKIQKRRDWQDRFSQGF